MVVTRIRVPKKYMSFGAEGLALAQLEVHYFFQSSRSFGQFYISLIQHVLKSFRLRASINNKINVIDCIMPSYCFMIKLLFDHLKTIRANNKH
jgi:hypothetical protein